MVMHFVQHKKILFFNYLRRMKHTTSIAIGGFDGMHIGHQALFRELDKNGTIVVIETGYANLTPARVREKFTSHPIVYLKLEDIRHFDGESFMQFLYSNFPKLQKIVVGLSLIHI